jgi:hypothetical protein
MEKIVKKIQDMINGGQDTTGSIRHYITYHPMLSRDDKATLLIELKSVRGSLVTR